MLKKIDLTKIKFIQTKLCNEFCTHDNIKTGTSYLALINNNWFVVKFDEQWFGLTAWTGSYWEQLSYSVHTVWKSSFQELYELPNRKRR